MTLLQQDGIELFRQRLSEDRFLAVLVTTQPAVPDPQVSVVNASVIDHPTTGASVVAFVARRGAKLGNLRANPRATLVARAGWEWVAARGPVELSGPDDPHPAFDAETQRRLLRTIYEAAGGQHPDLSEYDRAMLDERRCAVLLDPERIWTNPPASQHREP
jgi:hypothetical protein